jgi:hypothetical protein
VEGAGDGVGCDMAGDGLQLAAAMETSAAPMDALVVTKDGSGEILKSSFVSEKLAYCNAHQSRSPCSPNFNVCHVSW